jgi:hypothetical protein
MKVSAATSKARDFGLIGFLLYCLYSSPKRLLYYDEVSGKSDGFRTEALTPLGHAVRGCSLLHVGSGHTQARTRLCGPNPGYATSNFHSCLPCLA